MAFFGASARRFEGWAVGGLGVEARERGRQARSRLSTRHIPEISGEDSSLEDVCQPPTVVHVRLDSPSILPDIDFARKYRQFGHQLEP